MPRGGADKFVEILHDVRKCQRGSFTAGDLQLRQEARFSKILVILVSVFSNAIGVNN
jgi:hypothetical protein